ncbi:PrsW family glutamic-type intramembrane protease [Gryllotalpicola reticulitermitis]|uniref:PrsW family glutamic-type intramembrane protease n=1 Tax=Gryllotalpicola reticulitermitis TaxID=1184153 RepID=A0ABV8Q6U0_9MICO
MTDGPDRSAAPPPESHWPHAPEPPQPISVAQPAPSHWHLAPPPAAQRPPVAPQPWQHPQKLPRKWLGAWGGLWIVLGCLVIVGLEILEAWALRGVVRPSPRDYDVLDPTLLLIGGASVNAGFLYTMAYRLRPEWRLTAVRLVAGGLVAGFLAGIVAGMGNGLVDAVSGGTNATPSTASFAAVGFIEESAKLAAALLLGRTLPFKNGRIGLFVGAAVGFGFASVENFGYLQVAWSVGLAHADPLGATFGTSIARQLMGPLLHPVLTGLSTAAVFATSRGGRYRLSWGAVGAWLAVACAHSLFDLGSSAGDGVTAVTIVAYLVCAFLAWLLISRALKRRDEVRLGFRPPPPGVLDFR